MIRTLILLIVAFIVGLFIWNFMIGDSPKNYEDYGSCHIREIINNPAELNGKKVTITGEVTKSMNIGVIFYKINDGTGTITVKSLNVAPSKGKKVSVTGIVHQYLKVGNKQIIAIQEKKSRILNDD